MCTHHWQLFNVFMIEFFPVSALEWQREKKNVPERQICSCKKTELKMEMVV